MDHSVGTRAVAVARRPRLPAGVRHSRPLLHDWRLRGLLAAVVLLNGCAASLRQDVRHDVGRATRRDIELAVPDILNRRGYVVRERRDTGSLIYYETAWATRAPFQDEASKGAVECRTRIMVEARKGGAELYGVRLWAENSSLGPSSDGEWHPLAPTEMFQSHITEISNAIRLEIDAGVRVR